MGSELILVGSRRGALRQAPNPFTGKMESQAPLMMNETELRAALSVVTRYGGTLDDSGGGLMALERARLQFCGLGAEGCTVEINGDLRSACSFLFDLVSAGQMIILSDANCIVTTADALTRVRELDEELGVASFVESADELAAILAAHHASALAYASSVVLDE